MLADNAQAVVVTSHPRIMQIASGDLWAGAEVQLYTLTRTLHQQLAIPVSVVLLNHGRLEQQLRDAGIRVIVLDESKLNGLQILYQLVKIIRELSPDVIHTHRQKENTLGSIAAFISGRIASLRTSHGAPEHNPPWWKIQKHIFLLLDWLCGRFLQQRIVAVSDELAILLKKKYPGEMVHTIENGISLLEVNQHREQPRTPHDQQSVVFRIGIAGRLVPVKRVDLFIRIARFMRDNYPDLKTSFHIFGDGPLRDQLVALDRSLDTGDIVHFEGHCDDIHLKLKSLDALLMTSDHEGLPMILLEAMALQTPVIAHAVGGIPKLLGQGSCGILVQENQVSDYAKAIYKLATSPDMYKLITRNAYNRVVSDYSAEMNARKYLEEYSSLTRKNH